jgi:hypothetical protein
MGLRITGASSTKHFQNNKGTLMRLSTLNAIVALLVGTGLTAPAGTYSYTGSAYNIPDGNLAGAYSQISVSGASSSFSDITVTLTVSGGYNGDLYAYLSHDGKLVPLLNRIGVSSGNAFGSSGAGLNNLTLSDSGSGNIHAAGNGVLSGTYRPDGHNISPLSSAGAFNANGGSITLNDHGLGFGGLNPNGTWTLFFADVSAGGGQAMVTGWSLDITAVPEPVNVALGVFGVLFGGVTAARWRRNRPAGSA